MSAIGGIVVLTDRRQARRPLVEVVAAAVAGGVRAVLLREKDLPRAERTALAADLRPILTEAGGTLIVAGPDPLDGDAVHLPAAGPYPPTLCGLVGRSCHDEAELLRLTSEDYATLSPVFPSRSKPGYGPPLRPDGLASLIRRSPVPVLALGGIEAPHHVTACVGAGAAGVAVLGAIMRAENPTETAAELRTAFQEAVTPKPPESWHGRMEVSRSGLRPTVPTPGGTRGPPGGAGAADPPTRTPEGAG
ncbi:thiamine phosphate synthase, partial [Micromonospora sp. DT43]|uniref:thiamine phosphate synthase n=1 Tax=Micromonospora sp. DT43 TaxID=3393440 RepID=UPI003CF5D5B6